MRKPWCEDQHALSANGGRQSEEQPGGLPTTGAELVTYWHQAGVLGIRSEIVDSVQHAHMLRRRAETRHDS